MNSGDRERTSVPFSVPDITAGDIEAVTRVLRSGWLTTGEECAALEADLAKWVGATEVIALSSCTAALEIAIAYLDLPPGARIGMPTWTFAATGLAAHRQGAVPVLLDVEATTLNLAAESLASALEDGLDAVIAVHFGGVPVASSIHDLCSQAVVPLIEDAAHAFGARDHRGLIAGKGTVGACFSFYATKNLTSGEGGAIATEDKELAAFAKSYRLHGLSSDAWDRYRVGHRSEYDVTLPGIKANLPDILAALARSQLERFHSTQARRRTLTRTYYELLSGQPALQLIPSKPDDHSSDHLAVVLLPKDVDRRRVIDGLAADGIGSSVHFRPLHRLSWYQRNAAISRKGLSVADTMEPRVLSLPLHPRMKDSDVHRVVDRLLDLLAQ